MRRITTEDVMRKYTEITNESIRIIKESRITCDIIKNLFTRNKYKYNDYHVDVLFVFDTEREQFVVVECFEEYSGLTSDEYKAAYEDEFEEECVFVNRYTDLVNFRQLYDDLIEARLTEID